MADFNQLKADVANQIKTNGVEAITGAVMQDVLLTIINSIADGYMFGGVAQHSGDVGNPDYNVFYLGGSGSYTGYGESPLNVPDGCYCVMMYNGTWHQYVVDLGVHLTGEVAEGETQGVTGDKINTALNTLFTTITNILDSLEFVYNTPAAQQGTKAMLDATVTLNGVPRVLATLVLGAATAEAAGLLSAEDKAKLDAILANIRSMVIVDTTESDDEGGELTETLKWTVNGAEEVICAFTILAATTSKAGLLSADDKAKLDGIYDKIRTLSFRDATSPEDEATKLVEALSATLGSSSEDISTFQILAATASKAGLLSAADKAKLDALWSSGYQFAGIATPSTTPVSTTSKIFYIATEAGTYFNAVTVTQGINILSWDGTAWSAVQVVGIDDDPTETSSKLVESGGVFKSLTQFSVDSSNIGNLGNLAISTDGTETTQYVNYKGTGFIPVASKVKETLYVQYTGQVGSDGICVAGYNADKEYVGAIIPYGTHCEKEVEIPSTVSYIRACFNTDNTTHPASLSVYSKKYIPMLGNTSGTGHVLKVNSGRTYKVTFSPSIWDVSALGDDDNAIYFGFLNDEEVSIASYAIAKSQFEGLPNGYIFTPATNVEYLRIAARGNTDDDRLFYSIEDITDEYNIMEMEMINCSYPKVQKEYIGTSGSFGFSNHYDRTDYIAVKEGDKFIYSGCIGTAGCAVAAYDKDRNFISALLGGDGSTHQYQSEIVTIPSGDGIRYVIACGWLESIGRYTIPFFFVKNTQHIDSSLYGANVAIIGDSISTHGYTGNYPNQPEILITEEDVGVQLSAYLTMQDVEQGLTIAGHTYTNAEIGTEVTFTPTSDDVGKKIGLGWTYYDNSMDVWWYILSRKLAFNPIPAVYSGGSMSSHEKDINRLKTSYSWHPSQIRKCGIRTPGTMNRTAPDYIIIYKGTNDMTHEPYSLLTDGYFSGGGWHYPVDDTVQGGYGFKEAYSLTIKKLREAYPKAQIICCTLNTFRRDDDTTFPPSNGINTLPEYNNAIREIANFFGCPLIEFDKDGMTYENFIDYAQDYTVEEPAHPNAIGQQLMAERALKDLMKL